MLMPPWIHGAAAAEELPSCSTTTLMSRKVHQEIKRSLQGPFMAPPSFSLGCSPLMTRWQLPR